MGKWTDEARRMKPFITKGIQTLSDADALEISAAYPQWSDSDHYTAGAKARYGGTLYKCLQDHTAQAAWTPPASPSLWAKVLIPDDGTIPEWEQPDSTNPYMKGDKVAHNGKAWISDVDNNVWEPGFYGWTEVE